MRNHRALFVPIFASMLLAACSSAPTTSKEPAVPDDPWAKLSTSKEWLHATHDHTGDHASACEHVLEWVRGEESCKGSICEHGRDLASDWLSRCPSFADKDVVEEVRGLRDKLAEAAGAKGTACGRKLEEVLRDGCAEDKTCERTAQRWATRCGKSEGTPLALRLLESTVERKQTEPGAVKLDTRSCEELAVEVRDAAKCRDRAACEEAGSVVDSYRGRCEGDDARPTIATAVHELSVSVGAGKGGAPLLVRLNSSGLGANDAAVPLADGSGAVILICDERASDLERYLAARKACKGGKLVVARAFKGARGVEVRVGSLDFPDEATFSARYPTIVAPGELELRDNEELGTFQAALAKAAELAGQKDSASDAGRALVRAVVAHGAALKRSKAFKMALASKDDAFAPALKEIAKAKMAVLRGRVSLEDATGLVRRGGTRAFSDLNPDGIAEIGAATKVSRLDTTALLPRAMGDYLTVLKAGRLRTFPPKVVADARLSAEGSAKACAAAEKKMQESKLSLINCNFGLDTCDAAKVAGLATAIDEAIRNAEGFYHELDLARTGPAHEVSDELGKAAEAMGCREPWW